MSINQRPDTPLSNDEIIPLLRNQIAQLTFDVADVQKDVKQLLEVFLKLFEQFNELKDSPMLAAFFPAPRKK